MKHDDESRKRYAKRESEYELRSFLIKPRGDPTRRNGKTITTKHMPEDTFDIMGMDFALEELDR